MPSGAKLNKMHSSSSSEVDTTIAVSDVGGGTVVPRRYDWLPIKLSIPAARTDLLQIVVFIQMVFIGLTYYGLDRLSQQFEAYFLSFVWRYRDTLWAYRTEIYHVVQRTYIFVEALPVTCPWLTPRVFNYIMYGSALLFTLGTCLMHYVLYMYLMRSRGYKYSYDISRQVQHYYITGGRESIHSTLAMLDDLQLGADREVYHDCPCCRAAAAMIAGPKLMDKLYQAIDRKAVTILNLRSEPHCCPVKDGRHKPLLIAKLLIMAISALSCDPPLPEGRATKRKKKLDMKHYLRGGRRYRAHVELMSENEYEKLISAMEDGDLDTAEELVADFLERAYGDRGSGYVGGNEGGRVDARTFHDHVAERSQINTREYHAAMQRRPEGASPGITRAPLEGLPEGFRVMPRFWANGCNWGQEYKPELMSRHVLECALSHLQHDETVTALRKELGEETKVGKYDTPVVKAPEALLPSQAKRNELKNEAAKRKKKGKNKVVVDAPESSVPMNSPFLYQNTSAAMTFADGRTMQGYLFALSGSVWFVTGRHKIVGKEVLDGFEGIDISLKYDAVLHRPAYEDLRVTWGDPRGDGDDRVCLKLESPKGTPILNVTKAKTRAAVQGCSIFMCYYEPAPKQWHTLHGVVISVSTKVVVYRASTKGGCCRMVGYDEQGYVVSGHYFPTVTTAQGSFPGGEPETGLLPKHWSLTYDVPPLVPQADESHLYPKVGPYQRVEYQKIQGRRQDIKLPGVRTDFFMSKPSTEMNKRELAKFFEEVPDNILPEGFAIAVAAALALESGCTTMYEEPDINSFLYYVRSMDSEKPSAGSDAIGDNHHQYLLDLGDGDIEQGIHAAAERGLRLYQAMVDPKRRTAEDAEDLELLRVWCVLGKKDGYKLKKLKIGRTIQAPSFTMKLLWRVAFSENDEAWVCRNDMFRAGADFDQAICDDHVLKYANTIASLGLDETAFDRRMPRKFMEAFFNAYMPYVCPGVPREFTEFLASVTIDSLLLMTDGTMYWKDRGNPSGFPNTLRLNCIVQLFAWCYAIWVRLTAMGVPAKADNIVELLREDMFLEICGDDSRANAMTTLAVEVLGAYEGFQPMLQVWKEHLPWDVKIEGSAVFEQDSNGEFVLPFHQRMFAMPPLVSRNLFVADNYLWSPLYNADRCVRKLVSNGNNPADGPLGRSASVERELILSAFVTLKLTTSWHHRSIIFSPTAEWLIGSGIGVVREEDSGLIINYRDIANSLAAANFRQAQLNCTKLSHFDLH